jgi:hypothetical protein
MPGKCLGGQNKDALVDLCDVGTVEGGKGSQQLIWLAIHHYFEKYHMHNRWAWSLYAQSSDLM